MDVYRDELRIRNLFHDNIRITFTALDVRVNRNASGLHVLAGNGEEAERIFSGTNPYNVGPFLWVIEDAQNPTNFPSAILDSVILGVQVSMGNVAGENCNGDSDTFSEIDILDDINFDSFTADLDL